jgi:hypothetical protein
MNAASQLYGARPGQFEPLDGEHAFWRSYDGRQGVVLDRRSQQALSLCDHWGSHDELGAQLQQRLALSPARAAQLLDDLISQGLVERATELWSATAVPVATLPEPLIAIRTCDRPDGLRRLLQSLLDDERRWGVARRYLVVDDTRDAGSARASAGIVRGFQSHSRSRVDLIGPAARAALRARLGRELDPAQREALRGLVDPDLPGARTGARAWNLALLAAAGGSLSILDDDTVFPLRMPPGVDPRFEPCDSIQSETRWFDERDPAEVLPACAEEPFESLRRVVGQPAAALLRGNARIESLHGRPVRETAHLRDAAQVRAAFTGIYGALAFDSSVYLNCGGPGSLSDLWREPWRAERLDADRIWHGVTAPRLLGHAVYTPILMDTRELVPFAGTWGKADDTYCMLLFGAIAPDSVFAYSPLLLGHYPLEARPRGARALQPLLLDRSGLAADTFDRLGMLRLARDRAERLAAIGAHARDLGESGDATLRDHVVQWRQRRIASVLERLDHSLRLRARAPAAWRAHVSAIQAVNRAALMDTEVDAGELAAVRAMYLQAGSAAVAWPRLWEVARQSSLADDPACRVQPQPA